MFKNHKDLFDLVIIGGGPAGISALRWSIDLGLEAILIESADRWGGQLFNIHNPIDNYLGVFAENGEDFRKILHTHADAVSDRCLFNSKVAQLKQNDKNWIATLDSGIEFVGNKIVLATGVRRRMPDIPNIESFYGKGLLKSGSKEKKSVKGKNVVVVGGGDAAVENVIILSEFAKHINLIYRGGELKARDEFKQKLECLTNVEVIFNADVTQIIGDAEIDSIIYKNRASGEDLELPTDKILFRIGVMPNSELYSQHVSLDKEGYIETDSELSTNIRGLYAIGDVASPLSPTIQTATGHGSTVVKSIKSF